jgi:hypothetical protein
MFCGQLVVFLLVIVRGDVPRQVRALLAGPALQVHDNPHAQIADLRRKLDDMRCERDEYKQAAQALVRALNVLAAENDTHRSQASRLRPARPVMKFASPGPARA